MASRRLSASIRPGRSTCRLAVKLWARGRDTSSADRDDPGRFVAVRRAVARPRGLREVDAGLRRGVELGQCNRSAVLRARRHRCGGRPDGGHGARQRTIFPRADLPRRPDPRRPVDGVPDVLLGHGGDEPRASARSALREGDAARLRPLAPKWDRRTTRITETPEYSYELCGPDPTEDLYWLGQGPTGINNPTNPTNRRQEGCSEYSCPLGIQHLPLVAH